MIDRITLEIKEYIIKNFSNESDFENLCRELNITNIFTGAFDHILEIIIKELYRTIPNPIERLYAALTSLRPQEYQKISILFQTLNYSEDTFLETDIKKRKQLLRCVRQFTVKNFQCIKNIDSLTIPVDCQWIFIVGGNGDGKTAFLQALAIGLIGNDDKEAAQILKDSPQADIFIIEKRNISDSINHFYSSKREYSSHYDNDVFAYGVYRLDMQNSYIKEETHQTNPAFSLLHEGQGNHYNIESWLKDEYLANKLKESNRIKMYKQALIKLMPGISDIILEGKDIFYIEKDYKTKFHQLSSGNKSILAMAGDLLIRLTNGQPEVTKLEDFNGIVLIDELDLHLHPRWQRKLPGLLSDLFPGIQFWATTHSLVPLLGAPEQSIFFKLERTAEEGTVIKNIQFDMKNMSPNLLLTSPLFDVSPYSVQNKDKSQFNTNRDYRDFLKEQEIDEKIANFDKSLLPDDLFDNEDES